MSNFPAIRSLTSLSALQASLTLAQISEVVLEQIDLDPDSKNLRRAIHEEVQDIDSNIHLIYELKRWSGGDCYLLEWRACLGSTNPYGDNADTQWISFEIARQDKEYEDPCCHLSASTHKNKNNGSWCINVEIGNLEKLGPHAVMLLKQYVGYTNDSLDDKVVEFIKQATNWVLSTSPAKDDELENKAE